MNADPRTAYSIISPLIVLDSTSHSAPFPRACVKPVLPRRGFIWICWRVLKCRRYQQYSPPPPHTNQMYFICSKETYFLSGMEEMIQEELRQFMSFLKPLAASRQPVNMCNQFNLPILNALWRITVGDRFEYTDPQLLDIIKRMGMFLQRIGNPASLLAITYPWVFKAGLDYDVKRVFSLFIFFSFLLFRKTI